MNETLGTVGGRPVLRMERRLRHPAEKVWRALTEPKELSQWYPFPATSVDPRAGGVIRFEEEDGTRHDAVITDFDPPRRFAFQVADPGTPGGRETDNQLCFELHPEPEGCRLVFTHTFADRPAAASYAAGWQTCFELFDALLAGDPVGPPDMTRMPARHEGFVAQFGLDRAGLEDTPTGPVARIDRQLMMRDIDTVWRALIAIAPADPTVEPPTRLEYRLPNGGQVSWQVTTGPGGARVHLTQTPDPGQDPQRTRTAAQATLQSLLDALP